MTYLLHSSRKILFALKFYATDQDDPRLHR